jgi:hypothetical protein
MLSCPHCSRPVQNDPTLAGEPVSCPYCQQFFQMPPLPVAEPLEPSADSSPSWLDDIQPWSSTGPTSAESRYTRRKKADGLARLFVNSKGGPGILSILAAFMVLVIFILCVGVSSRRAEQQRLESVTPAQRAAEDKAKADAEKEGDEYGAMVMAERFVKVCLKYADDAEFVPDQYAALTQPNHDGQRDWVVRGKVKAANGFGTKLTHPYDVQLYKKNGEWKLRNIMIDGKGPLEMFGVNEEP